MAENVKVIVRCRPMNQKEMNMGCKNIVKVENCVVNLNNPSDPTAPSKTFTYDNAYDTKSTTESIYNDICYSLVENVLEGYNGTIFAYGQTGCGKSHTMQGPDAPTNEQSIQRGIIPRSFDHIFEAMSVTTGVRYLPLVSYLEIYNENIRDLLNPNSTTSSLTLKELPTEGIVVQNLSTHAVHNAEECEQLLGIGSKNRMVGATLMNAGSSRSHSIFTINLEQITTSNGRDDTCETVNYEASIKRGKLNLVDLAGSERQAKTGATGDRLKEATKINLSLSALGNVISALVDGKTKHIPYRDSKLTRLLQDSLGGNTKTLMIACISPAAYNYDETLSTLRYASRAKNISNKPKINEDPKDAMLREYQAEIMKLKQQLEHKGGGIESISEVSPSPAWIEQEKSKLKEMFEAETVRLKIEHEAQRMEKEELVKDMEKLKSHYEQQIKDLAATKTDENDEDTSGQKEEVINKIKMLKSALVGGECANDTQLKEKRRRKKLAAEHRMSALSKALNRIEQSEDRDILQTHYTDIQQELKVKTDALKAQRQKVRALEREVSDLQSEFQLDRTDYLESIRRLEQNVKFYHQLIEKALPILRKDGRYWDLEAIRSVSVWNDDLCKWKFPNDLMNKLKLPPAEKLKNHCNGERERDSDEMDNVANESNSDEFPSHNFEADLYLEKLNQEHEKKLERSDSNDIVSSYFRPRRAIELIHQSKTPNCWKEMANRTNKSQSQWMTPPLTHNGFNSNNTHLTGPAVPWQTIQSATTLQSRQNGYNNYDSTNNVYNKLLYGIRPTQNFPLHHSLQNSSSTSFMFQSQNYQNPLVDSENTLSRRTIRPMAATSRENSLQRVNP